jgi:hypothetical protein
MLAEPMLSVLAMPLRLAEKGVRMSFDIGTSEGVSKSSAIPRARRIAAWIFEPPRP